MKRKTSQNSCLVKITKTFKWKKTRVKNNKNKESRKNFLLFKQSFKQVLKNKTQLIGLAFLVLLSSTIFSLMQTSIARVNNEYESLISQQQSNLHDFIVDPYNTAVKQGAGLPAPILPHDQTPLTATLEPWQQVLDQESLNQNHSFVFDRVEARTFLLNNNGNSKVLKLVTANIGNYQQQGNVVDSFYGRVDKLVIIKGKNIGDQSNKDLDITKQVVINQEFAQKNNLNIGDVIRVNPDTLGTSLKVNYDINDLKYNNFKWLKIVGFGTSADFTTPIIDQTTPMPNKTKEGILYVNPRVFGLYEQHESGSNNTYWFYDTQTEIFSSTSDQDKEIKYVAKFIPKSGSFNKSDAIQDIRKNIKNYFFDAKNSSSKLVYALGDSNYRFDNRTSILPKTIHASILLLVSLLLIVLMATGLTVILVTVKNIDNSKPQFGVLKSLGYSNWKLLFTSLTYPMVASLLGTILVFFPASSLQILVVNSFSNFFNLNFGRFDLNPIGFLYCLALTFGFLSLVSWIVSAIAITKPALTLLHNESIIKKSFIGKTIEKWGRNRRFLTRFRLAIFTSSIGKMTAVALTMFLGTSLMTTAIIGPKIMKDNQRLTYTGMNYKTLTEYETPVYNSPFSFYKTYDPQYNYKNNHWESTHINYKQDDKEYTYYYANRGDAKHFNFNFVEDLLNNSVCPEAYAPVVGNITGGTNELASSLQYEQMPYLYGKMFTKAFIENMNKTSSSTNLMSLMVPFAWPDATNIYQLTTDPASASDGIEPKDFYSQKTYGILRSFYLTYRATILMAINKDFVGSSKDQIDLAKFTNFMSDSGSTLWSDKNPYDKNINQQLKNFLPSFEFIGAQKSNYPLQDKNDDTILKNPTYEGFKDKDQANKTILSMLIWYSALYYNQYGQTIAQGTYSRSPYYLKQNMAEAFADPNKPFNISFGVIPFDKNTDELGTYINAATDSNYKMKIYGLQNEKQLGRPSYMQLYDQRNHSLNSLLENNSDSKTINIVVNQTVAKQLGLRVNNELKITPDNQELWGKDNNQMRLIKNEDYNFENNVKSEYPSRGDKNFDVNNSSLINMNTQLDSFINGGIYANMGIDASPMSTAVKSNEIQLKSYSENKTHQLKNFKVVGIYDGYGQPAAYISKTNADQFLNFSSPEKNVETAQTLMYKNFYQEWTHQVTDEYSVIIKDKPVTVIDYNEIKNYPKYDDLLNATKGFGKEAEQAKLILKLFNREYPIFNFKYSINENAPDIYQSYAVTQSYGDFTPFGLNGGSSEEGAAYPALGKGAATMILPLQAHRQLLQQLTDLVNTILLFFIIFALLISFFIILLTSDLVIYENRKIIATMKTLGYSDFKITNIVIGMYIPVLLVMFIAGLPAGWFIISFVINFVAFHSAWVLPLFFAWWIPVVIAILVTGIYIITFVIEWYSLQRVKPLLILSQAIN